MKVILPAAGYGTRLYPLTIDKPKALLKICEKPIIEYIIEKIRRLPEVDGVYIVSNNRFYNDFLEWQRRMNIPGVEIINDGTNSNDDRLGTVGDILFAIKKGKISDDILVINSDNIFSFDLGDLIHKKCENVIGVFDVGSLGIARNMGSPVLDENLRVISFKEKDPDVNSTLCSVGIYLFRKRTLELFERYILEGNKPDRSGDFVSWLCQRTEVFGHTFGSSDFWFDIGSLESYREAEKTVSSDPENWSG